MQLVPYCWEVALFFFLLKRFPRNHFERAHRGTLGTYRYPSMLWYFAPVFTWGPIAGGETVPFRFLPILSWKGRLLEVARMILQRTSFIDPLILLSLYKAKELSLVTNATKNMLPAFAAKKAFVDPDFFKIDQADFVLNPPDRKQDDSKLKILYVGKLVEWKGLMFVLKALQKLHGKMEYEFNLVGEGPDRPYFQAYASKHGLKVYFRGRMERKQLSSYYYNHDLFVSPDIHGRGSNTIAEAKMHQLPVLMLDVTDPDLLTGKQLNLVIDTQGKSCPEIVDVFSQTLLNYSKSKCKAWINA
jgi:glycosyltransferase involved in cell wall biosynthesis